MQTLFSCSVVCLQHSGAFRSILEHSGALKSILCNYVALCGILEHAAAF